jgi:hypothetical protein
MDFARLLHNEITIFDRPLFEHKIGLTSRFLVTSKALISRATVEYIEHLKQGRFAAPNGFQRLAHGMHDASK